MVVAVVGPTAVGKSDIAVALAKLFNGEVISADSRQVYRGLDIGTGKITVKEMDEIPHHLLDVIDPKDTYTVADFQKDAGSAISDILQRGKLPILCGGTGLFIDTVLYDFHLPAVPPNRALRTILEEQSADELYAILLEKDPIRANTIDRYNKRRLVRALEIIETSGAPVPPLQKNNQYDACIIGISIPFETLKEKIKMRLEKRLNMGMVEEVQKLHDDGLSWHRMEDLGLEYRWIARFLQGAITRQEMEERLYLEICQYAKRQMTWFKKNNDIVWVGSGEEAEEAIKAKGLAPRLHSGQAT